MQWASTWQITTHAGMNPFCLCCCQNENPGGTHFHQDTGEQKPNPFLRVRPAQADVDDADQLIEESDDFVYATESFDRQQQVSHDADSRWLRRHRELRVPAIDVRLVVAFQRFLRIEEVEFLLLLAAIADEDC